MRCRQQVIVDNERLRLLQEAEAACEAEALAAARAVEYRNELRHRLDIQVMPLALVLLLDIIVRMHCWCSCQTSQTLFRKPLSERACFLVNVLTTLSALHGGQSAAQ